ncbi:hypothetical protein [Pseudotenacibaculum haliotis]|uniref:Tail fiber protein n=1 Tax=Pseudotenacibaculum haliotis TaxID=1862138 RepID=A0ABW5LND3_9FLAO
MDRIEFYSGGFPVTTSTFDFLQNAHANAISALTKLGGNTFILTGVQKVDALVTQGAIVYNGEYLPFQAGPYDDTVGIYETVQDVAYNEDTDNDGNLDNKRAYVQRYAKCGTDGLESFSFNDLKSFTPLTEISMPIGLISMWSGVDIPQGWALCDGTNGTPNLTNRFIVGSGDEYNIGDMGGSKEVAITIAQLPPHNHDGTTQNGGIHKHTGTTYAAGSHSHSVPAESNLPGTSTHFSIQGNDRARQQGTAAGSHTHTLNMDDAGDHNHDFTTNNKGNGEAHENRPPYYALAFIMFKGL